MQRRPPRRSQYRTSTGLVQSARNETVVLPEGSETGTGSDQGDRCLYPFRGRGVIESWDTGGAIRIIPLVTIGLDTRLVAGQTEPHWQGWSVYGEHKKPVPTAIHRWRASNRSTSGWLLVPALQRGHWCVGEVERIGDESAGESLHILVHRSDGGRDYILRRPPEPALPGAVIGPRTTSQDVAVVCLGKDGKVEAELTAGLGDVR